MTHKILSSIGLALLLSATTLTAAPSDAAACGDYASLRESRPVRQARRAAERVLSRREAAAWVSRVELLADGRAEAEAVWYSGEGTGEGQLLWFRRNELGAWVPDGESQALALGADGRYPFTLTARAMSRAMTAIARR